MSAPQFRFTFNQADTELLAHALQRFVEDSEEAVRINGKDHFPEKTKAGKRLFTRIKNALPVGNSR